LVINDYTNIAASGCSWIVGSTSNLVAICDFPIGVHYFDIAFNVLNMVLSNETIFTLTCTDYNASVPAVSMEIPVSYAPAILSLEDRGFLPSIAVANSYVVSQIVLDNFGGACDQVNCTYDFDQLIFTSLISGGSQCTSVNSNRIICATNSVVSPGGMEFDVQFQVAPNVQATPQLIRVSCIDGFQKYSASVTASLDILLPFDTPSPIPNSELPLSSGSALHSWLF